MTALTVVGVALLGGCGAVARHVLDARASARLPMTFPIGIFVVNLSGAFALGLLAGLTSDKTTLDIVGVGLAGSFTTFSTWMFDTAWLTREGERRAAVLNIALSLPAGLLLAWLGMQIG